MNAGADDQSRFGPLTDSEKDRFLKEGAGSDSATRWLDGVLLSVSGGVDNIFHAMRIPMLVDTGCREGRERVLSEGFRHLISRTLASEESASQKGWHIMSASGPVDRMEPMTAYSADTLIRFAMDRHDATGMLCSDRIGNPVGTMLEVVRTMPEGGVIRQPSTNNRVAVCSYMNRHMAIPVATHPFSSLQGIVNAVCYGAHGNGRMDRSKITRPCVGMVEMAPLSGTMEYSGPDCHPRLMAMMLEEDALFAAGNLGDGVGMVVSSPGVEKTGIPGVVAALTVRLSGLGVLAPFVPANPDPNRVMRLPVADYGTMTRALADGRYAQSIPCLDARNRMPDFGSELCFAAMRNHVSDDGLPRPDDDRVFPDTYAMIPERVFLRTPFNHDYDYGIMPDMADIAWALTFPRPEHADTSILRDLLKTVFNGGGFATVDETLPLAWAGAWSGFVRTLPLRDPIISDAMMSLTGLMVDFAMRLISASRSMPADKVGIMLIPSHALDMFFTDMRHGLPYDFALQTLLSRSYVGVDRPRDPGFHGLVVVMPYMVEPEEDGKQQKVTPSRPVPNPPIPGTTDMAGEAHPEVFMIP